MTTFRRLMYVVYLESRGRTPVGIFRKYVAVIDAHAFVMSNRDALTAEVHPRQNVFEKEADAQAYLAGKGPLRWVVDPGGYLEPPLLYQAHVHHYVRGGLGGNRGGGYKAVKRADGKPVNSNSYRLEVFDTKKEALAYFRQRRDDAKKDLLRRKKEVDVALKALSRTAKGVR